MVIQNMNRVGVMQIVDTLDTGGAERVAVNIANCLPRDRYMSCICSTRRDGGLAASLHADVGRLSLKRQHRFDLSAGRKLIDFIKTNNIRILHAHGASLFLSAIVSAFVPGVRLIWHDHFGRCGTEERPIWLYKMASIRTSGVVAVNTLLAEWSRSRLSFPADRVWYVPNFVSVSEAGETPQLPGTSGKRIICVANFRPQKDHLTLLRALAIVIRQVPDAHLLLVGTTVEAEDLKAIQNEIASLGLGENVKFLGQRTDVAAVLRGCDIGVLSSTSEGLPLSLLEYGVAGLATVSTGVGQCSEVLDEGRAGLLVPPSSPTEMAAALVDMLSSPEKRAAFGKRLSERIAKSYSAESTIRQICAAYDVVLGNPAPAASRMSAPAAAKIVQQ